MSELTTSGRLRDLLEQSLSEKAVVVVYFRSGQLRGTVAKLDDQLVELSTTDGRGAIRLDRVDAVARE
jgi:sRNA-binding regulator protein Hfq